METLCGLTTLPGFTFWTASEWIAACTKAKNEIVGDSATSEQISAAGQRIGVLAERYMFQAMNIGRDKQVEHLVETTTMFSKFTMDAGKYAHNVVENLLKSILIQAWGAYETLAEDLVVSALEKHTECFGPSRTDKKLYFRRLSSIRDAYKHTFASDQAILACLSNPSLDALALLRHVLIHKAGIVDPKFLAEGANVPLLAPFVALKDGTAIKVDGSHAYALVTPAVQNGFLLVKAVDDWLVAHKP